MLDILQSIQAHGIIPATKCSIRGSLKFDEAPDRFYFNQIDLARIPLRETQTALASLVYHEKEGMWAIAMERTFVRGDGVELTTAMMNSIVFIFELEDLAQDAHGNLVNPCSDVRLSDCSNQKEDRHYFDEVRNKARPGHEGIPRQSFKAALVPYHLVDIVRGVFPDLMVIPVNSVEKTLEEDPIELFTTKLSHIGKNVIGPNYLRGLELFIRSFPQITKIGFHNTRLPMTPIPAFADEYTVTAYNQQYWGSSRLQFLKPQQLALLRQDRDILIFPENRTSFLAYYKPEKKGLVSTIVLNFDHTATAAVTIQSFFRTCIARKTASFFEKRRIQLQEKKQVMLSLVRTDEFSELAKAATAAEQYQVETMEHRKNLHEMSPVEFLRNNTR